MNTNDLPLAQQLAALMEAGRVANPQLEHIKGGWGDGKHRGCAMTFAFAGAGTAPQTGESTVDTFMRITGTADRAEAEHLMRNVIHMNDKMGAPLEDIIAAVRDGTLPEAPPRILGLIDDDFMKSYYANLIYDPKPFILHLEHIKWIAFDEAAPAKISVGKVGASLPKVDKSVRVSAKTGASWPKPKRSFA